MSEFSRRDALAGLIGLGVAATPLSRALVAAAKRSARSAGYGPLQPTKDLNTGLELLHLPEGFSYRSFGWTGDPLNDGTPTPNSHDGMGVVHADADRIVLVRNHEVVTDTGAFGSSAIQYDPACGGGTVTLELDARDAKVRRAQPSLSGTLQNCAGGVTPWGTWLSCEEFVHDTAADAHGSGDGMASSLGRLQREHGFVFEVSPWGEHPPKCLEGLGQFRHEAAAVDARSHIVYLTEDRVPVAAFYRFVPKTPGKLDAGGRLQALRARDGADLRRGVRAGQQWHVAWVDIAEPGRGHTPGTRDGMGVVHQAVAGGASRFTRLEGCIVAGDVVYFTATNGGDDGIGQVFAYYPKDERLVLLVQSQGRDAARYPDNVCVSPRGALLICEDGDREGQMLWGLTPEGHWFPFARNDVRLRGDHGIRGDFRGAEWAGCCYTPDGRWLFANIYSPGFSVAITGPWRAGLV
jgi:hypothetical protein